MKRFYCWVLLVLVSLPALAQDQKTQTPCTQILRLVRSTYESGRLHEIPNMVAPCLERSTGGFTDEEKRETYRYLTLTYIYLEEPEKADEAMLKLLETDHFFQISSLDPAEFKSLYKKFRTDPVFKLGIRGGLNVTQNNALNYNYVGSAGGGLGKYGVSLGFHAIASFEKEFSKPSFLKKLVIAPELGFMSRKFSYSNPTLAFADEDPSKSVSNQTFLIAQSFLDLNGLVQYKFTDKLDFKSYIGGGPSISYLLSSTFQPTTVLGNGFTNTEGAFSDAESYRKLTTSFIVTAGIKRKIGGLYLTVDVRYQYGLSNMINSSTRTNPSGAFNYQVQYNDYRMNTLVANLGLIYPYFKPKKLIK